MFVGKEDFKIAYRTACIDFAGKALEECSTYEKYDVLVQLIRNRASKVRTETRERINSNKEKQVYYFSMEFLIGRLLNNYLLNMGIQDIVRAGLRDMGEDLDQLCEMERDPGLGNGGLGRLAACFLDSMAFLGVPGTGIGIRYRFGLFQQKLVNGYQTEVPDTWLDMGYPWEDPRPDRIVTVKFGGYVDRVYHEEKRDKIEYQYKGYQEIHAVPYDVPVVGYGPKTVNRLRLWYAQPKEENFDLAAFNRGDYAAAVKHRNEVEAISCILYPDDSNYALATPVSGLFVIRQTVLDADLIVWEVVYFDTVIKKPEVDYIKDDAFARDMFEIDYIGEWNRAGVAYTIELTLKRPESTKWKSVEGAVRTLTYTVSRGFNALVDGIEIEGWVYGDYSESNLPTANAKFGTVTFEYSNDREEGYTTAAPAGSEAGAYWVPAVGGGP